MVHVPGFNKNAEIYSEIMRRMKVKLKTERLSPQNNIIINFSE